MKYQTHPLQSVIPSQNYELICFFVNGEIKKFDFKPVFEECPKFKALTKNNLFFKAHVDLGGLCVTFNDKLDISEEALYQNGVKYSVKKENKEILKNIYAFCKKYRKTGKITQKQMAKMTKIPQSGIARIESGKNDVQIGTLLNYLAPLGLTIEITKKKASN